MIFAKPDYVNAIVDLVKYFGWRRLDYVFDSHEGRSMSVRQPIEHGSHSGPRHLVIRPDIM